MVFSIPQNQCYPGTSCSLKKKNGTSSFVCTFKNRIHSVAGLCCLPRKWRVNVQKSSNCPPKQYKNFFPNYLFAWFLQVMQEETIKKFVKWLCISKGGFFSESIFNLVPSTKNRKEITNLKSLNWSEEGVDSNLKTFFEYGTKGEIPSDINLPLPTYNRLPSFVFYFLPFFTKTVRIIGPTYLLVL